MVSGMTVSNNTLPNSSSFSAMAPTAAEPICFSAMADANPVNPTASAAAIAIRPMVISAIFYTSYFLTPNGVNFIPPPL